MPGLGEYFVEVNKSAPPDAALPRRSDFETPSSIKPLCPVQDVGYFAVQSEERKDLPSLYRLVAMSEDQFRALAQAAVFADGYTTMTDAKARADELNEAAYAAAYQAARDRRSSISVSAAANNQTFRL